MRRRLGSVGRPLPTLELEIRGPDGEALGPGQSGEVYVRGEQISGEYLHKKVMQDDGWFATNDAGWLDDDGYLFVEGRLDDVIVRGGENISPGEIEDVLRQHPQVADVAVFGVPDDQWGERVACAVVPREAPPPSRRAGRAGCRSRLRSTKTPEIWAFRDALPYNETGKLLRRQLKAEMSAQPARRSDGGERAMASGEPRDPVLSRPGRAGRRGARGGRARARPRDAVGAGPGAIRVGVAPGRRAADARASRRSTSCSRRRRAAPRPGCGVERPRRGAASA